MGTVNAAWKVAGQYPGRQAALAGVTAAPDADVAQAPASCSVRSRRGGPPTEDRDGLCQQGAAQQWAQSELAGPRPRTRTDGPAWPHAVHEDRRTSTAGLAQRCWGRLVTILRFFRGRQSLAGLTASTRGIGHRRALGPPVAVGGGELRTKFWGRAPVCDGAVTGLCALRDTGLWFSPWRPGRPAEGSGGPLHTPKATARETKAPESRPAGAAVCGFRPDLRPCSPPWRTRPLGNRGLRPCLPAAPAQTALRRVARFGVSAPGKLVPPLACRRAMLTVRVV